MVVMAERRKTICIVGGGFGGVRAALDLAHLPKSEARVMLITPKTHFEFTPGLYRVVGGKTPRAACITLREIFAKTSVELCTDSARSIDPHAHVVHGISGSHYAYDYLVLAVGSETSYFNVPGLKELSFGFKTIEQSLRLKNHLIDVFASCAKDAKDQKVCATHVVVVGGGPAGVETAAELAAYCASLAKSHGMGEHMATIDLVEGAERILPSFDPRVSEIATQRLRSLGVNIFTNRPVVKEDIENVYLTDMRLKAKTVVWAAGIVPNVLTRTIPDARLDRAGRVLVDEYLRMQGNEHMFVIGDSSAAQDAGTAQAAIAHGKYVARTITALVAGRSIAPYTHKKPAYVMPLGPRWAIAALGGFIITGFPAWLIRQFADARFFASILPASKAYGIFKSGEDVCEACNICLTNATPKGDAKPR